MMYNKTSENNLIINYKYWNKYHRKQMYQMNTICAGMHIMFALC